MKKLFIPVLAFVILAGCGKELNDQLNKTSSSADAMQLKEKGERTVISEAEDTTNVMVSNVMPCEYYPPGSPFSCNPGAVTDDPVVIYPSIGYQNGYLKFNTLSDFTLTYDILDSLQENFTGYDYAMGLFGGDLDKIDSLLDARGVDESKPLRDFETKFSGFYSLRKDMETKENSYLDNGGNPAGPNSPENIQFTTDDIFRTLLNKDGVVVVENIIFKVFQNGVTYAIMNNSTILLNKLQHPESYGLATYPEYFSANYCAIDTANIKLLTPQLLCEQVRETLGSGDFCSTVGRYSGSAGATCKLWYTKSMSNYYDNNKRLAVSKVAVYNSFIYDVGLSKIRNYKIKSNGKWKPTRTKLGAFVSEDGCSLYNKSKNVKYRKFRRCAKRDVAEIPGIGGVFRGIRWMAENIKSATASSDYFRFFKTATNQVFYGKNYCNGTTIYLYANW